MTEQNANKIRVVFAGGGTGGHLYPAIALAQEIEKQRPAEILFIGTSYGLENKVLPELPYKFKKIWIRGLHRGEIMSNLLFPLRLLVSLFQCLSVFLAFRPKVVIGTGGYVSGPALLVALMLRIPTAIQEQNSYPGLVNRLLGKRVQQVHVTFADSKRFFRGQEELYVSGSPVRGDLHTGNREQALARFNLAPGKTTMLIFGGSQGARAINDKVLASLDRLLKVNGLQILWATGPADWPRISDKCRAAGSRLSCHPYLDDMAAAYAAADFALCRSGASTLSELAVCGLPAILVPLPTAAAGHQDYNARSMEQAGAGIVITQNELTEERLLATVSQMATDAKRREEMATAAKKMAKPDAARDIVQHILSMT